MYFKYLLINTLFKADNNTINSGLVYCTLDGNRTHIPRLGNERTNSVMLREHFVTTNDNDSAGQAILGSYLSIRCRLICQRKRVTS